MTRLLKKLRRTRFVYRRSSQQTKMAVITALVLSVITLTTLAIATEATRRANEEKREQAAQLEQENDRLEENVDSLGSGDSVEQIAKDELDMVDKDTVIVKPEG